MAFLALSNLLDLYDGYSKAFSVNGHSLLLIQDARRHYVIENRCPHMNANLAGGKVVNGVITCRAHGLCFNLSNGLAEGPLASTLGCLTRYSVAYDGNKIGVNL